MRVLSPGKDGDVTQTNSVDSSAKAGNLNLAGQKADQDQGGSGGTQAIGQDADNDQSATALSAAKQDGATNRNIPVRVLSRGDGGDVTQSNSVDSSAAAGNLNVTKQYADQDQGGKSKGECGCASDGIQAIGQEAKSEQSAGALSVALQSGASNTNTPVRVGSKGDDGDVSQSNSVDSKATALNANLTGQKADQDQRGGDCRCADGGTQAIGQKAKNDQSAAAASLAAQSGGHDRCGCGSSGNTNTPVRVDSKGDGGSVEQSNSVDSKAAAGNLNLTWQLAGQGQSGSGTQAIGQEAKNEQDALAASAALQSGASNTNTPVRVDSKGDDGDVAQSNSVDSKATALNANLTKQDADQSQYGHSCGCGSDGIQAIGQEAKSEQGAAAFSLGLQHGASNDNAPVRVDSKGDGGSVDQSNSVDSTATAANLNALKQDADQKQSGSGGTQAIGQEAKNEQAAIGLSAALQFGASNSNSPVRVDSKGDSGDVSQSNSVDSNATGLNVNLTKQDADQDQGGRSKECGCHEGTGIQAIGQEAKSEQGALAASLAAQAGASNKNAPVGVDSYGHGGSVDQSNSVDSDATAANLNALKQDADQEQGGGGGIAIQAIGQSAKNEQAATGLSAALQFGASNTNSPVAVGGDDYRKADRSKDHRKADGYKGDRKAAGGDVTQSNSVESDATALNINLTKQDADQDQGGRSSKECGCTGHRHPGDRPGSEERAGRIRRFAGHPGLRTRQVRLPVGRQLEHARGRRQPRLRRLGRPVERGELVGDGTEPERAPPGRGSGSVRRWRHAGSRPVGEEQPVRDRPVSGTAARREERDGKVRGPSDKRRRPAGRHRTGLRGEAPSLTCLKNRSSFEKRPGDRGDMARRGRWSLLRRRGTPAGGIALLCLALSLPAYAATPVSGSPAGSRGSRGAAGRGHDPARTGPQGPAAVAPRRSSTVPRRSRARSRCRQPAATPKPVV